MSAEVVVAITRHPKSLRCACAAWNQSVAACGLAMVLWLGGPYALASPPTLDLAHLIGLASQQHPSISAARAQHEASLADMDAARAQYYPAPSLQVQQSRGQDIQVMSLQQPLWAGGRIEAAVNAAKSRAAAASLGIHQGQHALALRVTAAWAAWLQARGRIDALTQGVALLEAYAASVARRIEGGATGEVDRELVVSRLAQTKADLDAAQSAERSALARLTQLTGQRLRASDLSGATATVPPPAELATTIAQTLAQSAALQRLEADIEAAQHELRQRRGALWPTLSLRAQHQRGSAPLNGQPAQDSRLMLQLDYTPGAGLSTEAAIAAAAARSAALRDNLEAARRDLIELVTADHEDFQTSSQRKTWLERTMGANADVLASYERLFNAGRRSWLDVVNAVRELIQAHTALADAHAQQLAAHARLRLHTGELRADGQPPAHTTAGGEAH